MGSCHSLGLCPESSFTSASSSSFTCAKGAGRSVSEDSMATGMVRSKEYRTIGAESEVSDRPSLFPATSKGRGIMAWLIFRVDTMNMEAWNVALSFLRRMARVRFNVK